MEIDEIIRTLKRIWTRPDQGYVFLPWIPAKLARDPNKRKESWNESPAFKLPEDWKAIRAHIEQHWDDDLYFTPMVFSRKRRASEYARATSRLWADLDEADPREVDPLLHPTIAWETSPGRYAAVWCMRSTRPETTERGGENHRLTIAVGADPSGWDTTQLLRVPGSANNKPGYRRGYRGKLLWDERQSFSWNEIDALPELPVGDTIGGDLIEEQALESVDAYAAYARLRRNLSGIVRQYMRLKEADDTMDRSSIAWQIERDLADAGATLLEMVAIMRPTPWNKHYGRRDELKRLTLECAKALAVKKEPERAVLESDSEVKHKLVPFWNNEAYIKARPPEWLYDEFIPKGGCGFISGIPKSMKTWFAMDLCISAAMGVPYLGYDLGKHCNVLYVQREDPTTLVRDRHHIIASSKHPRWALSDDMTAIKPYPGALYVETNAGIDVSDDDWQVWLAEQIRDCDLDLIVLDTLVRVAPGVDFDSATASTAMVLNPMKEIARDNDCAIAFVHHNTKAQSNARAAQNMAGSGQVHAWADFGIYITEKREGFDFVEVDFTHETKYTGTTELRFRMEGLKEGKWDPEERMVEAPTPKRNGRQKVDAAVTADGELEIDMNTVATPRRQRKGANERLIRAHLKEHAEATVAEVVEATGLSRSVVGHHLKRIRSRG